MQIFQFELVDNMKIFTIYFNAVSEQRNYLTDVVYDGFSLDITDLQRTHKKLYNRIYREMLANAIGFWKQQSDVPTLAYQVKKLLTIVLIMMLPIFSHAQDTIHVNKVKVCTVELSRKTNKPIRKWFHMAKVKSGYIVKEDNGLFLINGKEMIPNYDSVSKTMVFKNPDYPINF
jgi:hypothetical protein